MKNVMCGGFVAVVFAAAAVFIKLTMAQIGPALGKALTPISTAFTKAGKEAGITPQ